MKEKILELRKIGLSYNEIAKKLKCSKSTISYHCSKMEQNEEKIKNNLLIKNKRQEKKDSFLLETDKIDEVIQLRKEIKTYDEIKEITGLSILVIKKICREYGLTMTRKFYQISDETIRKIKDLYFEFGSIRRVSKEVGVDRGTVSKYINKKNKEKLNRKSQLVKGVIEWRKRKKIELVEYKGGECERCGYKKCVDALDFHHKNPIEKDFTIGGKSWSLERLKKEADKCILVCANCHREIHFEIKNRIFPDSSEAEQTTTYDKKIHTKEC